MSLTKIGSIGINTGIQLAGITTVATLHVGSGLTLSSDGDLFATGISTFSENIKVGSGITLSPDGDVFATGISTFSENIKVGSGITLSPDGDVFAAGIATFTKDILVGSGITLSNDGDVYFTGIATGNGSGLTALNASNISSGTVPTARLGSGTASSSTFLRGDSTFATVTTTTINNNADNRVITGSDTADTLNGEANLTYNSTLLTITGSNEADILQLATGNSSGNTFAGMRGDNEAGIRIRGGGSQRGGEIDLGGGQRNTDPAVIKFSTNTSTSFQERARITADGEVVIGQTTADHLLSVVASNSATPRIGIVNPDNDENFNVSSYHDSNGMYVMLGVNSRFDSNGNFATDTTAHKASAITMDARNSGSIQFHTTEAGSNASERLRITSTGQVNIGAATPTASDSGQFNVYTTTSSGKAQFVHAAGTGGLRLAGTGAGSGANLVFSNDYSSGTFSDHWTLTHNGGDDSFRFLAGGTSGSEVLRIKSDGSIGILAQGVNAGSGAGEVTWPKSDSPFHLKYFSDTNSSGAASYAQYIENYVGSDVSQQKTLIGMAFHDDNSNDRPQVKFGAEVGQRGDANTQLKEGSGNFVVYTNTGDTNYDDSATEKFVVQYNGTATISGSTVTSDARLKTDVTTLTGTLDKVKQLRGVEYLWNDVAIDNRGMVNRSDGEKQIGVIADEVKSIYPVLVEDNGLRGRDGTQYKQVAYEKLVPILLEAIKELAAKVEALEG